MLKQWEAVDTVLQQLKQCQEVKSVFLKGSLALDKGDDYSDVDLYCLVESQDMAGFLAKRLRILESYRPLIFHTESNFVGPQIVAVYDNGLHFDLYTVTQDEFPPVGRVKPLYDPDNILAAFMGTELDHSLTWNQVVEHFNSFSFTLVEFHAAWERGDLLWSIRLASHLAGELGVILRYRYDPENAMLGTKRLEQELPDSVREAVREAVVKSGEEALTGVLALCSIMQDTMSDLEQANQAQLDWRLFGFMINQLS